MQNYTKCDIYIPHNGNFESFLIFIATFFSNSKNSNKNIHFAWISTLTLKTGQ